MLKMKRFAGLLTVAVIMTAVAGCGKAESGPKEQTAAEGEAQAIDDALYLMTYSIDGEKVTGEFYHNERILKDVADKAQAGDTMSTVDGTEVKAVSFEDANEEIGFDSAEELKADATPAGGNRIDKFLVRTEGDDGWYFALELDDGGKWYNVVGMLVDDILRTPVGDGEVTLTIPDDARIGLLVYHADVTEGIGTEWMTGKEFKTREFPDWTPEAEDYYIIEQMYGRVVVNGSEIEEFEQIFLP